MELCATLRDSSRKGIDPCLKPTSKIAKLDAARLDACPQPCHVDLCRVRSKLTLKEWLNQRAVCELAHPLLGLVCCGALFETSPVTRQILEIC
jgi:hypothetical protein